MNTENMGNIRPEFIYLNALRESGACNMFLAAPFIEDEFDLSRNDARKVVVEWMTWVNSNPQNLEA